MKNKKSYIICLLAIAVIIFIVTAGLTGCKNAIKYDDSYDFAVREGCSDFYYSHLSENQQKMYKMLYKEAEDILYNGQEKDNLGTYRFSDYGLSFEEAETVWYAFRYDASAFFIISNSFSYNSGSMTVKIAPEFLDKSVREKVLEEVKNSVEEVRQLLDGIESSAMKFKIIYDYVINHTEYSADDKGNIIFNGYSYSMAGVLDGDNSTNSICQGYTQAVKYLCNIFGVECLYVGSEAKDHAVNIVNIDEEWYYADATLDDTKEDYKYFLNCDDKRWQELSQQYENASENYLRACLPELKSGYVNPSYFYGARTGDFYCSISKNRDEYYCSISGCVEGIESIVVPKNFGIFQVTSCSIYNCKSLKSVKVSEGFIYSGSYDGCVNLTSVELPQTIEELGSFSDCKSLESIEIPSSVTKLDICTFQRCSSLKNVNIPSGVTVIEDYAFDGCSSLESIEIPSGVLRIGECAFFGCSSLKSIDIPDTVYTIGRYADWVGICYSSTFANCTSLEYIKLPSTLQFIGTKMFSGCSSLTSIIIPIYSVYRIYSDAFEGCDNLTIYCEAESKPTGWDSNWNGDRPVVWGYKAS